MNVSVIIPLYNAEKYIAKAIESCLQLKEVKEVIIIDDGHPDRGREIAKDFISNHPQIKLVAHPNRENKGASASRNLGLKNATQEFVAFLDADDYYLPNRFVKDKKVFIENPDADGCYNALGVHFYSEDAKRNFNKYFKRSLTTVSNEALPTPGNLFKGLAGLINGYGYFSLNGLTIKRKAIIKNHLCFNENLHMHEDTEFIIKLAYHCCVYPSEINNETAKRGVHKENRITTNFDKAQAEKNKNRYLQWTSLNNWAKKEEINDEEVLNHFKNKLDYFRMMMNENPSSKQLFKEIKENPGFLKNPQYATVHFLYLRKWWRLPRVGTFRLRNLLTKFL